MNLESRYVRYLLQRSTVLLWLIHVAAGLPAYISDHQLFSEWQPLSIGLTIVSIAVFISAIVAVACCACRSCQSKGAFLPQSYYSHTHDIRQTVKESRVIRRDPKMVATKLFNIGVRATVAQACLEDPKEMFRLGITEQDIASAGSKEKIVELLNLVEIERMTQPMCNTQPSNFSITQPSATEKAAPSEQGQYKTAQSEYNMSAMMNRPLPKMPIDPNIRRMTAFSMSNAAPTVKEATVDQASKFDDYTIYDNSSVTPEAKNKAQRAFPEQQAGLDRQADFDEYTIYDQGSLNEYGLLKEEMNKKLAGAAGLDKVADFDDYTIYDQGALNEYGLLKEKMRKLDEHAGVDHTSGFEEYTIYDQGPLNEYGIMKAQREMKKDEGYMTEETICRKNVSFLKGPSSDPINQEDSIYFGGQEDRDQGAESSGTGINDPSIGLGGLSKYSGFDDYTIYNQGPLNEYGRLKEQLKRSSVHDQTGTTQADFDEYTIYDQGHLNEYGILKEQREEAERHRLSHDKGNMNGQGGASSGIDAKADFDEYTIYDTGSAKGSSWVEETTDKFAGQAMSNFDEYTIYYKGGETAGVEAATCAKTETRPKKRVKVKEKVKVRKRKSSTSGSNMDFATSDYNELDQE